MKQPIITLPKNQAAMRQLLVSHYHSKGGGKKVNRKILVYTSTVALCAMLFAGGIYLVNSTGLFRSSEVSAQELVNKMTDKVRTLTEEERARIESRLKDDLEISLEEARNAPDLKYIPEERLERIDIPAPGKMLKKEEKVFFKKTIGQGDGPKELVSETNDMFNGTGKIPVPKDVKYVLQYSNPNGAKVMLGVNEQETPVMKMIQLRKVTIDGDTKEVQLNEDTAIGIPVNPEVLPEGDVIFKIDKEEIVE